MSLVNCATKDNNNFYLNIITDLKSEKEELEFLIKEHSSRIRDDNKKTKVTSPQGLRYLKRHYNFVCYDISYFENLYKTHVENASSNQRKNE